MLSKLRVLKLRGFSKNPEIIMRALQENTSVVRGSHGRMRVCGCLCLRVVCACASARVCVCCLTCVYIQSTQALRAPQLSTLREMIKEATTGGEQGEKENDVSVVSVTPEKRSAPISSAAVSAAGPQPVMTRPTQVRCID